MQVASQKRKLIEGELDSLKSKQKRFSDNQATLEELDAEKGKLVLLLAASAIWAKAEQQKKKLTELDEQIKKKSAELVSV